MSRLLGIRWSDRLRKNVWSVPEGSKRDGREFIQAGKDTRVRSYPIIKHGLDTIAAIILIIVLFPLMVLAAIAIKLSSEGPIVFKQDRLGKDEKIFRMYKFRTMTVNPGEDCKDKTDYKRLTRVGLFLRKTSIDEFPQLINVLKQEMSFIGPRPLLTNYLPFYSEVERRRHSVRPGISGWAQVNGRNTLSWEQKFRYDIEYVDHYSWYFDVRILVLTFKKLFYKSEVITAGTAHSEMPLDRERLQMTREDSSASSLRDATTT
jgi:undecaprenyl phosphate N,N'-diacetylbacillosamine 1-phosphate transferase